MFVGHFHNKNTQFYGYRLFSDVKITPFFFKQFFWTASEILFTDIKLYCRKGPNIQKTLLIKHSLFHDQNILTLQHTSVPFHKQKQNVKIVTFYHGLTPAPHGPTLKQKSGHTKRVITSNCTKFLKYAHKIWLLEIMQNASSTTRYFF